MIEESRYVVIMQAAQNKDPSIAGEMNEEEKRSYNNLIKEFDEWRAQNGGTLKGIDIDIPYSY